MKKKSKKIPKATMLNNKCTDDLPPVKQILRVNKDGSLTLLDGSIYNQSNTNHLETRGLKANIVSKLVTEGDKSDQMSICGTVYMSKTNMLVIQTKIWNKQPYWDFRVWYKNDEGNFLPTKKGFMIASQHNKSNGEITYPFNDFIHVINEVRNITHDEKKANEMANEAGQLTTAMLQGEVDRGTLETIGNNKGIAQSLYNPMDKEFIGN